jgi:hypothetical protein
LSTHASAKEGVGIAEVQRVWKVMYWGKTLDPRAERWRSPKNPLVSAQLRKLAKMEKVSIQASLSGSTALKLVGQDPNGVERWIDISHNVLRAGTTLPGDTHWNAKVYQTSGGGIARTTTRYWNVGDGAEETRAAHKIAPDEHPRMEETRQTVNGRQISFDRTRF